MSEILRQIGMQASGALTNEAKTSAAPSKNATEEQPLPVLQDFDEEGYFIPPDDLPLPDINEIRETDRASTPKVIATITPEQMRNPYKLWGFVVIRLREQNLITLHTACGELRRIKLDGDNLIVEVNEEYLFKILTNPDNFSKISLELSKINDKIKLNFVLKVKENKVQDSYNKLKVLFGEDLESNFNTFGAN